MGQSTKVLRGVCTPGVIKELLEAKLSEAQASVSADETASDANKKEEAKELFRYV